MLERQNLTTICDGLKHNFLYNNDINSIHILLNLYDIENNMNNIPLDYKSIRDIKKNILSKLYYRKDKELVSRKIAMMIHEDVDRLELICHLEGYIKGCYSTRTVNMLEDATIKVYPLEKIYEHNYLFHYSSPLDSIKILKRNYFNYLDKLEKSNKNIYNYLSVYLDEMVKSKIYRLNENLDRQLKVDYIGEEIRFKDEETFLNTQEIQEIYDIILNTIYKNAMEIYKDSSWFGVNDKLLDRY